MLDPIPDFEIKARLRDCYRFATNSQDPSTQTAAGLLLESERGEYGGPRWILAHNRMPDRLLNHEKLWAFEKHDHVIHAEQAVILDCAALGYATEGATMIAPWAPCAACARFIIEAGIVRLVVHQDIMRRTPERWLRDVAKGIMLLHEAKIEIVNFEGRIGGAPAIRFDGGSFQP